MAVVGYFALSEPSCGFVDFDGHALGGTLRDVSGGGSGRGVVGGSMCEREGGQDGSEEGGTGKHGGIDLTRRISRLDSRGAAFKDS